MEPTTPPGRDREHFPSTGWSEEILLSSGGQTLMRIRVLPSRATLYDWRERVGGRSLESVSDGDYYHPYVKKTDRLPTYVSDICR